jgi:hypothetical protein
MPSLDIGVEKLQVGILVIAGWSIGEECRKFCENSQYPGDIILMDMDENQYSLSTRQAHTHGYG